MKTKEIKLNSNKVKHYRKIVKFIEDLKFLLEASIGDSYTSYGTKVHGLIKNFKTDSSFTFSDFIAEINSYDEVVQISFKEYESFISANSIFKSLTETNKKSHDNLNYEQYGIIVASILKGYYKEED